MRDLALDITVVGQAESTNALALEAIEEDAPAGTVFVADRQTAGRGRRGTDGQRRRWFSPPGKNLYFSVVARPNVAVAEASRLTLATGVELVDLLRERTDVPVQLKWPNDLYVQDRKLGGILTEATTDASGLKGAAVGVGLNVNVAADEFPSSLAERATSLLEQTGRRHDRLALALAAPEAVARACRQFEHRGLEAFSDRLQRWNYLSGRRVTVQHDGQPRGGVARNIGPGGGLVVEFDDGPRREIVSGQIDVGPSDGGDDC